MYFFLCQQIPEWFPDFDYFSFFDCNNLEGGRKNRGGEEHLAFGRAVGLGQWSLLISCLHESTKSLEGTDTLWRQSHWLATSHASAAAWRAGAICYASIWILRKVKIDGLLLLTVRRAWSKAPCRGTGTTENLVLSIRAISFGALWWRVLSIAAQSGSLLSFNDSEMWKEAEVLRAKLGPVSSESAWVQWANVYCNPQMCLLFSEKWNLPFLKASHLQSHCKHHRYLGHGQ